MTRVLRLLLGWWSPPRVAALVFDELEWPPSGLLDRWELRNHARDVAKHGYDRMGAW